MAFQLLEQSDERLGVDAQTGEKVDLIKAGIIDPTKVVRSAIQGAAGVASLMLTTEAMVVNQPEEKKDKVRLVMDDDEMEGMGGMM